MIWLAVALIASTSAAAQGLSPSATATTAAPAPTLELFSPMRDGVKLAANVYLPSGKGPWPVVLVRTPYLKDGRNFAAGAPRWTAAGYAYVVQDVLQQGPAQGFIAAFVHRHRGFSATTPIEGAVAASHGTGNGAVGMTGASTMGITTNLAPLGAARLPRRPPT